MNQQLRILIYFILVFALALILKTYLPFNFRPSEWNYIANNIQVETEKDSLPQIVLPDTIKQNILLEDDTVVEKDTVITHYYLSCPTTFIKQLHKLNMSLLETKLRNQNIRILHYGDSQIEGDRITAYLRESFQKRFGGSGPGLTTVYDPQRINPSVWLDSQGEWQIHNIYNRRNQLDNNAYGLMGRTASLSAHSKGEFKISASRWAEPHASRYQKIRLFIAPHSDTLMLRGKIKNEDVIHDSLAPSKALTEINWEFEQISPSLKIQLESKGKIHILGCALDSITGVSVDNIALRGQSSPMLHKTNSELFTAMGEHLNIGMIILQFGTNVIPTVNSNYNWYKIQLSKQFDLLKQYLPGVPIIVVGIADAAHLNNGKVESYKHLKRIRDAQKAITLQYQFAFFDLYEAMGGEGSIIKWTKKDPPWALTDYIHLSRKGGEMAAAQLTKALWHQFDQVQKDSIISTQTEVPWESF